jgi:hypothetical protein
MLLTFWPQKLRQCTQGFFTNAKYFFFCSLKPLSLSCKDSKATSTATKNDKQIFVKSNSNLKHILGEQY